MENQPGEQFGRYELVSQLGRGGMAETWRARLLGAAGVTKPVLIKKVLPEFSRDSAFTEMFISEARITATLSHGNIAQVFDFGEVDGEYFLAMEFVDGQPLNRLMKRAAKAGLPHLPVALVAYIGLEMCRGLHYAHSRTDEAGEPLGIVHRDISPDNVLVSYEGQVKIVDFGIAKARALRNFKTEAGVVKGKYLFFSPEQARGEEVDARTDVWATGVVLYELLTGRMPLEGPPHVVLQKLMLGDFPPPDALRPGLPPELNDILLRALTVERDARTESCHELGNALAGFLYATAPRFSSQSLSFLVKELFRQDLAGDGREARVPPSFLEELAAWKDAARTTSKKSAAARKAHSSREREALVADEPPSETSAEAAARLRLKMLAVLGGVAALGIGAAALVTIPSEPPVVTEDLSRPAQLPAPQVKPAPVTRPSETPTPAMKEPAAAAAAPVAAPVPEKTARGGSVRYPVDTLRLEAARDVVRPSGASAHSPDLDPRATYRLYEENPPADSPPLFYLLSGDALAADATVGTVSHQPVTLKGVRKVTLFTLGTPRGRSPLRTVQLENPKQPDGLEPIRVDAEMSAASMERAFTLEGLDGARVYELKLEPEQDGALLRGPDGGAIRKIVCARQTDPATETKADLREQQFLLQPGKALKLKAARALSCGFVDTDAADNSGSLEVRISEASKP